MRVLMAEDERVLADRVAKGLCKQAIAVDLAYDGDTALERLAVNDYDVLVLDRDLPGMHGDQICRELVRRGVPVRILMLTASGALHERIDGLNLGADDYLAKPFSFEELVARIRALARRSGPHLPPVLQRRGITLDTSRCEAVRDGRRLPLSPKEYAVLEVLMRAQGTVVSAEELLERAWDEHIDPFTAVVKVTISKVRGKLGDPPVITTIPGSGYRL